MRRNRQIVPCRLKGSAELNHHPNCAYVKRERKICMVFVFQCWKIFSAKTSEDIKLESEYEREIAVDRWRASDDFATSIMYYTMNAVADETVQCYDTKAFLRATTLRIIYTMLDNIFASTKREHSIALEIGRPNECYQHVISGSQQFFSVRSAFIELLRLVCCHLFLLLSDSQRLMVRLLHSRHSS